jgi:hypothetical protein
LVASASGATVTTSEEGVTKQGTSTFAGEAAGIEGAPTISMKEGNPVVLT